MYYKKNGILFGDVIKLSFAGRAPMVQEFAQFLLNFEGNELVESPRKTLGILQSCVINKQITFICIY